MTLWYFDENIVCLTLSVVNVIIPPSTQQQHMKLRTIQWELEHSQSSVAPQSDLYLLQGQKLKCCMTQDHYLNLRWSLSNPALRRRPSGPITAVTDRLISHKNCRLTFSFIMCEDWLTVRFHIRLTLDWTALICDSFLIASKVNSETESHFRCIGQ